MDSSVVLWIVVGTALAFDFTNGFHDTANSVATSISTRALSPRAGGHARGDPQLRRARSSRSPSPRRSPRASSTPTSSRRRSSSPASIGAITWNLADLVLRPALLVVARADRRRGRRDVRGPGRVGRLRQRAARPGHRPGARRAGDGVHRRRHVDPDHLPDRRAPAARAGHARIPARPGHLREPARALARHERRAEDDGDHLPGAGRQRHAVGERRHPDLGRRVLGERDRARHLRRRLADHPHDGQPDHQDGPGAGLRGPGRRRRGHHGRVARRLPALDDPRHLRRDHGRPARPSASRRSAGAWRATSSPRGC